jgi:hypothetical protein
MVHRRLLLTLAAATLPIVWLRPMMVGHLAGGAALSRSNALVV